MCRRVEFSGSEDLVKALGVYGLRVEGSGIYIPETLTP